MDAVQSTDEEVVNDVLNAQEREKRRLTNKPFIDHLDDAVIVREGVPHLLLAKGKTIIIERTASVLSTRPWLDTRAYLIVEVDIDNGNMKLWDEDLHQHALTNYITGIELGYRFKIPAPKGAALPVRNKAKPKEKTVVKEKSEEEKMKATERRIYSTKGQLHTRIKGIAYVPNGSTQAADAMRLLTSKVGSNLKVRHPELGWEETWIPKDM